MDLAPSNDPSQQMTPEISQQIQQRLSTMEHSLQRIREATGLDGSALNHPDKQDVFILNLQRAIQAAVQIATYEVLDNGLGVVYSIEDHFELLRENGYITTSLANRLKLLMVYYNIAAHEYHSINMNILRRILHEHYSDLEAFLNSIRSRYGM